MLLNHGRKPFRLQALIVANRGEEPPIDFDGAIDALPLARWQEEVNTGQRHASNFRGSSRQPGPRPTNRERVRLLVAGADVRILTEDRELLRALTLDPTHSYQPLGGRWPVYDVLQQVSSMS